MEETCGGYGTYIPNFKTMQIADSRMPNSATPFLEQVSNLTYFIRDNFETEVTKKDQQFELT